MLGKKIETIMNEQIKHELYSAYLYLSMAAQFEAENLLGFAHWMKKQSQEEMEHAMKFFDFINERGGKVALQAIEQPPLEFGTPKEIFKAAFEHEQKVTALINKIYKVALEENDYASQTFLHWFINEQVEEEAAASEIVETLNLVGDKGHTLFQLDRQLAQR
jgi:ferritin